MIMVRIYAARNYMFAQNIPTCTNVNCSIRCLFSFFFLIFNIRFVCFLFLFSFFYRTNPFSTVIASTSMVCIPQTHVHGRV